MIYGIERSNMITIIFERNRECIADEVFPSTHLDVAFEEEDDTTTILDGMVSLLHYAGYRITKEGWDKMGEEIDFKGHFSKKVTTDEEEAYIAELLKGEENEEK